MKKINYLIIIILVLQVVVSSNKMQAQNYKSVHADDKYFWDKNHKWNDRNTDFYNFRNLNGKMIALKACKSGVSNHHSQIELYTYNHQDKEFNFTKHIEDIEHVDGVITKPIAFEFAGRNYIMSLYKKNGLHKRKLYYTKTASLKTWYSKPAVDAHDVSKLKLYRDAWYSGDSIYLAYYSYYKKDGSGDEKLHYTHDILVDVGVITSHNNLIIIRTIHMDNVMDRSYYEPFAIEGFVHADGKPRLLISYTDELADDKLNKGGGTIVCNPENGSFKHLHKERNFRTIRAIHGSMKARQTSPSGNTHSLRNNPNRIQVFYNYFNKSDDRGYYFYRTYAIDGNHYHLTAHGKIKHHDKELPDDWKGLSMEVTSRYIPHNSVDGNQSNDGFHKSLWLFRANKRHHVFADIFKSDQWKSNASSTVSSHDLMNTDETTGYGAAIRSLWTLIGVTEGAPPAPIDWEAWHEEYPNQYDPTSLRYKTSTSDETMISQTYHRTFYSETGVAVGGDKTVASGHASFRFTNAHRHTQTESITTTNSITENFTLTEESQPNAKLIWSVPNISRISYAIYPWWDTNYQHPQDASTSFMFFSPGSQIVIENVPISSAPFNVTHPNSVTMEDWKEDTSTARTNIFDNAGLYNILPISIHWAQNNPGSTASIVSDITHTNEVSKSHSFDIDIGGSIKIPLTFEISEDLNFEWGYENTVLHATTISKDLEVSLKNMNSVGINLSERLNIETYYFDSGRKKHNGDEINWWYYDDFVDDYGEGHKPWYITYIVTYSNKTPIVISKPYKDGLLNKIPKISWLHDTKEAHQYAVLFSSSHRFEPNKTIEIKTQNLKHLEAKKLKDLIPTNAKVYWVIKAINDDETTWSKTRWFHINRNAIEQIEPEEELNFTVYPNPTTTGQVRLLFTNSISNQNLTISLQAMDGQILTQKTRHSSEIKEYSFLLDLPATNSGIYVLSVKGENSISKVKLLIN